MPRQETVQKKKEARARQDERDAKADTKEELKADLDEALDAIDEALADQIEFAAETVASYQQKGGE